MNLSFFCIEIFKNSCVYIQILLPKYYVFIIQILHSEKRSVYFNKSGSSTRSCSLEMAS